MIMSPWSACSKLGLHVDDVCFGLGEVLHVVVDH